MNITYIKKQEDKYISQKDIIKLIQEDLLDLYKKSSSLNAISYLEDLKERIESIGNNSFIN